MWTAQSQVLSGGINVAVLIVSISRKFHHFQITSFAKGVVVDEQAVHGHRQALDSSHVSFYENSFTLEAGFPYVVSNIIL